MIFSEWTLYKKIFDHLLSHSLSHRKIISHSLTIIGLVYMPTKFLSLLSALNPPFLTRCVGNRKERVGKKENPVLPKDAFGGSELGSKDTVIRRFGYNNEIIDFYPC